MELSVWAILISIVIGIASNLLTPHVAKFLGNISKTIKKRNEQKRIVFENTVQFILENPQEETNLRVRYWGKTLLAIVSMSLGVILMFSSNVLQIVIGFLFFLVGNYGTTKSNRLGKITDEVGKRKKISHPKIDLD
jgi:hypothetical protein